jgi:hypothetical protein
MATEARPRPDRVTRERPTQGRTLRPTGPRGLASPVAANRDGVSEVVPDLNEPSVYVDEIPPDRAIVGRLPERFETSDPEWKYVNVRRYLIYLEHSIDQGTQWTVFEPNDESLWSAVRRSVTNFLYAEWQDGALKGDRPEEAFFVTVDRTTMTQNDIDNGRLVIAIGVAPVRPAEFVIFRIGQWTAVTTPEPDPPCDPPS